MSSEERAKLIGKDTIDSVTGMPDITLQEKNDLDTPVKKVFNVIGPLIFVGIGTGIASAVYAWGDTAKFDSKITLLNHYEM